MYSSLVRVSSIYAWMNYFGYLFGHKPQGMHYNERAVKKLKYEKSEVLQEQVIKLSFDSSSPERDAET